MRWGPTMTHLYTLEPWKQGQHLASQSPGPVPEASWSSGVPTPHTFPTLSPILMTTLPADAIPDSQRGESTLREKRPTHSPKNEPKQLLQVW